MVKPSLAQHRLGGPPTEVPIPSNLPHAVELCSSSLSSSLFKNPKPCVSAFGTQATGPTRPRSCTWMLKSKSRISSNCSFQISRVSNQNRLHLYHDRLWFSGDVCILVIQRREQLEQPFLSSPGHNPFQSLVTVSFFIGNSSLLSLYFSWHSFVRWRAMFVLDYEIEGCAACAACEFSNSRSLTPWPVGRASWPPPRGWTPLHLAALEGRDEVVELPLRSGASVEEKDRDGRRPQSCRSHGNCVGEESGCLLLAFNICPSGSFSCLCMKWCFWYRHPWQVWFDELLVLLSCVFFWWKCQSRFARSDLSYFLKTSLSA